MVMVRMLVTMLVSRCPQAGTYKYMCDICSADQYRISFYAIITVYDALQGASYPELVRTLLAEIH